MTSAKAARSATAAASSAGMIAYVRSASFFLLGYLWMLWDKEKQTWQDKFAGSVVVPVDAYR